MQSSHLPIRLLEDLVSLYIFIKQYIFSGPYPKGGGGCGGATLQSWETVGKSVSVGKLAVSVGKLMVSVSKLLATDTDVCDFRCTFVGYLTFFTFDY